MSVHLAVSSSARGSGHQQECPLIHVGHITHSHLTWVGMEIVTSLKQLSAAASFDSIPPTTFSPHPTLRFILFYYPQVQLFLLVYTSHPVKALFLFNTKFFDSLHPPPPHPPISTP